NVQHPERHFQSPTSRDLFQAAVGHCPAPLYEAGMHPHYPAMPWMPGIADFAEIPNMGVVLLSCITRKETTKARTICCCPPSPYLKQVREAQSVVASGSVAYSSITAMPHELFDQTRPKLIVARYAASCRKGPKLSLARNTERSAAW